MLSSALAKVNLLKKAPGAAAGGQEITAHAVKTVVLNS